MHSRKNTRFNPAFRTAGLILAINEATYLPTSLVGATNEIVLKDGWIQITPYGEWPNEVGLQIMDRQAADAMVKDFQSIAARLSNNFRGLPFYVGHPDDPETGDEYPDKKSYGWWKELEARNDGLYGKPRMSKAGNEMIEEGHYMYVSPFWGMTEVPGRPGAYRPAVLYSVGLTNNPQIPGQPVGRNEKPQPKNTMKPEDRNKLITALGLKADATDEQIIAAVNEANTKIATALREKADADTKVATAANEKKILEGQVSAANTAKATAEEATRFERTARIDVLLTTAVNEGRITEADRPAWAGHLTADFDGKAKELAEKKKAVNTRSTTSSMGTRRGEITVSGDKITAINTAVSKHMKDNGVTHDVAYDEIKRTKPELFEDDASE